MRGRALVAINGSTFLSRRDLRRVRDTLVAEGVPASRAAALTRSAPTLTGQTGRAVDAVLHDAGPLRTQVLATIETALNARFDQDASSHTILAPAPRPRGRPREARCCSLPSVGFSASIEIWPSGACVSEDGRYRYRLWRRRDVSQATAAIIVLNPELADEHDDDTTTRNCTASAARLGLGADIVSLYPWRGRPKDLASLNGALRAGDAALNEAHLRGAIRRASALVIAIGAVPDSLRPSVQALRNLLEQERRRAARAAAPLLCLGLTRDGLPRHPGRIFGGATPIPYGAWPTWTVPTDERD